MLLELYLEEELESGLELSELLPDYTDVLLPPEEEDTLEL